MRNHEKLGEPIMYEPSTMDTIVKVLLRFTLMPDAYSTKMISPLASVLIDVPSGIVCSWTMPDSGRICLYLGVCNVVKAVTELSMCNTKSLCA